jgi:hypothetical protein
MYEPQLGFSLKPPSWLRNIVGAVVHGTTATVPTPAGPVSVDLGDPASVARARAALTGTRFSTTVGTHPAGALEQANAAVSENVPGGWLTIAGVGLLAVFVLPKLVRGR